MILKRFLFFLIPCIIWSCNNLKGPEKPKNLISKEKMVDILIDTRLITSANSKEKLIMRDEGLDLNNYVYEKHNIDSLQFALSNSYYAYYVEEYEDIYTKLTDSLEVLKEALKAQEAKEWKKEADSLEAVSKQKKANGDSLTTKQIDKSIFKKLEGDLKKKTIREIDETKLLEESIQEIEGLVEPISDKDFQ
ncbi:DUF4296 domain-containing protein [Algibacter pectinivorans]|uniref:DUF4296 domain-containing protein n=1 Tax=Algibacter pectinivorans TaxID=870482 RepID=A0A1I1MWW7_9FLAO|nr:DUF4296 domain-containing protein [Algibacter pectinivorans]SFC86050.1 protein of unknown function [Algibacter pectinivorans]